MGKMDDEYKSKLQKVENFRVYANNNIEFIDKDLNNARDEIQKGAAEVFRDPKSISPLLNALEMQPAQREVRGEEARQQLANTPGDLGRLAGGADVKEKAAALGEAIAGYKDLLVTNDHYQKLNMRTVNARKMKPEQLSEELQGIEQDCDFADTVRDNRIKGRTWSAMDNPIRHFDKGLQISQEEREQLREKAREQGLTNPLEL